MDLQVITVWIIGIIVAGLFVRWLFRTLTGRNRTGCAACDNTECPFRQSSKDRRRCAVHTKEKNAGNDTPQIRPKNRMSDF